MKMAIYRSAMNIPFLKGFCVSPSKALYDKLTDFVMFISGDKIDFE